MKWIYSIIMVLPLMAFSQEEATFYVQLDDLPLDEALVIIEKTFDVRFSYQDKVIDDKTFNVEGDFYSISEILNLLTTNTSLKYNRVDNRYIIITKSKILNIQKLEDIIIYGFLTQGITKNKDASYSISPKELGNLPGLIEPDILESIQQLPGVISPNETATGLVVRGGTVDQNRLIWDGINMYHKGHLFGMISPFNPNAADDVVFINKGTNPRFGERVSSVINIKSKSEISNTLKASIGINALNADAYLELPIIEDKLSIQTSVRRSYTELFESYTFNQLGDKVFQSTKIDSENNTDDDFSFLDYNIKVNYQHNLKNKFSLSLIAIDNRLDFFNSESNTNTDVNDILDIKNVGYSATWDRIWSNKLSQSTKLFFSDYQLNYNLITSNNGLQISDFDKRNKIFDSGVLTEFNLQTNSRDVLSFGYEFNLKDVNYAFINTTDLSFVLDADKNVERTHSVFGNYNFKTSWLDLNLGFRTNYYNALDAFRFEPRLLAYIPICNQLKLQVSSELKNQIISEIDETVLSDLTLENRLWRLANGEAFPIINSLQSSFGFIFSKNGWRIDVDNYYKRITNISALSLGFLNPENSGFNIGDRNIIGSDIVVEKRYKRFKTWLSYSYTFTENKYDGINNNEYFTSSTNVRHAVNLSLTYSHKQWNIAAGWRLQSGKPFTESIINTNDVEFLGVNQGRLKTYHRLDLSATYNFNFSKFKTLKGKIGCSIRNVYNRNNQLSREYTGNNSLNDPIEVVDKFSLGFTPNILFRIYW
ncbi:DUF4974 domain-containing protein [Ichthyenterobacterium sp. W332]|uniref:DUF4974 domain-containing protein n=1 Tax=Microcosmobacter mediterraneus TaxID=3075607 RepID=A0ABU2YIQ9_9FLAO|nr:FecR domain-containing protein [Ichthyenterobacterium sp. W332]MDT0557125.1 DUF4974 domain-containing protein [Ichthyenterobacterium sp. W332]